jgi:hypothetical protein
MSRTSSSLSGSALPPDATITQTASDFDVLTFGCPYPASPPRRWNEGSAASALSRTTSSKRLSAAVVAGRRGLNPVPAADCDPPYPTDEPWMLPFSSFRSDHPYGSHIEEPEPVSVTADRGKDVNMDPDATTSSASSPGSSMSEDGHASTSLSSSASGSQDPRADLSSKEALADRGQVQERWRFFDLSDEELGKELLPFAERCERCGRTVKDCEKARPIVSASGDSVRKP